MPCKYCNSNNLHSNGCPEEYVSTVGYEAAVYTYNRGYQSGRRNEPLGTDEETFMLGYHNGQTAREVAISDICED